MDLLDRPLHFFWHIDLFDRLYRFFRPKGEEWYVTCYHCGQRVERTVPRRPQDPPEFLCGNCQAEHDELVISGAEEIWPKKIL